MKYIFMFPIIIYRKFISPYTKPRCKYCPTCSQYALMAYKKYGVLKATFLTIYRLIRCNPWSKGGIDYP